jgi:hypothetical protein
LTGNYPVARTGSAAPAASVSFPDISHFEGFLLEELAGTFVPTSDYFCNPRDALSRAGVEMKVKQRIVSC